MICAAPPKLSEPAIIDCVVGGASDCERAAIIRSGVGRATRRGFAGAGGSVGGSGGNGSATAAGSAAATDCGTGRGAGISAAGGGGAAAVTAGTAACSSGGNATGTATAVCDSTGEAGAGSNINCTPVGSLPASFVWLCANSATATNARTWPKADTVTVRLVAPRVNRRVTPNPCAACWPIRTGSIGCAGRHDGSLLMACRQPRVCPADGSKNSCESMPIGVPNRQRAPPELTARQFGRWPAPDGPTSQCGEASCGTWSWRTLPVRYGAAAIVIGLLGHRVLSVLMPPSAAHPVRGVGRQGSACSPSINRFATRVNFPPPRQM